MITPEGGSVFHQGLARTAGAAFALLFSLAGAGCGGGDPPPPQIHSFTADKTVLTVGDRTTLHAVFTDGTGVIDQGIGAVTSGASVSTGPLAADRTYTLTVTNTNNNSVSSSVAVQVVPAPRITGFTAAPDSLFARRSATISWITTGATAVTLDPGGTVPATGSTVVTPTATTTYTLNATNAAGATVVATATVTVLPLPVAEPRISVDRSGSAAVFRNATGRQFVPRGSSYVRLDYSEGLHHSTFQPGLYSPAACETALAAMEHDRYNVVRVFVDYGYWDGRTDGINGAWTTPGLEPTYLDNLGDFLLRATQHHLYVMLALEILPHNQHYVDLMQPVNPAISSFNTFWLDGGPMQAKKAYVTDLVDGLAARIGVARLSTIFAYELESEMFYSADLLPFSSTSLSVTTADGQTYSMADPAQREACADNNMVYYANLETDAIKARDPGALVTIGAFTYRAVGKDGPAGLPIPSPGEDQRFPVRISVLARQSRLDFVDLHTYPLGAGYTLAADLASSEWSDIPLAACPVLMGEFGAFEMFYPDITAAAALMRDHQIEGWNRGFSGFLYWTYDTENQPSPQLWTLVDGNGAINQLLAPLYRPDPGSPDTVSSPSPMRAESQRPDPPAGSKAFRLAPPDDRRDRLK